MLHFAMEVSREVTDFKTVKQKTNYFHDRSASTNVLQIWFSYTTGSPGVDPDQHQQPHLETW